MALATYFHRLLGKIARAKTAKTLRQRASLRFEQLENRELLNSQFALDFGPSSAPVAPGFVRGTAAGYSAAQGYGWAHPKGISLVDRGTANPLMRDFAQASDEMFLANVDNGWYTVRVFFGDPSAARPSVKVIAEGNAVVVAP